MAARASDNALRLATSPDFAAPRVDIRGKNAGKAAAPFLSLTHLQIVIA
jgi:hypothetical protein